MSQAEDDRYDAEWRMFRYMLFAAHPTQASEMLLAMDEARAKTEMYGEEGYDEFAPEDEGIFQENFEYEPFSAEEVEATVALLRRFGVAVEE